MKAQLLKAPCLFRFKGDLCGYQTSPFRFYNFATGSCCGEPANSDDVEIIAIEFHKKLTFRDLKDGQWFRNGNSVYRRMNWRAAYSVSTNTVTNIGESELVTEIADPFQEPGISNQFNFLNIGQWFRDFAGVLGVKTDVDRAYFPSNSQFHQCDYGTPYEIKITATVIGNPVPGSWFLVEGIAYHKVSANQAFCLKTHRFELMTVERVQCVEIK